MLCPNRKCIQYQAYRVGNCAYFRPDGQCLHHGLWVQKRIEANKTNVTKQVKRNLPSRYSKYGLSQQQQDELLSQQNGRCVLCSCKMKNPQLDHDHKTNRARGYLCRACNTKLAGIDDEQFRDRALKYLKNPPADEFYT